MKTYTKEEVIKIIDDLLQMADPLENAMSEDADYNAESLFELVTEDDPLPDQVEPGPIPQEGFPSLYAQGKDVGYKRVMADRDKWFTEELERRMPEHDSFADKLEDYYNGESTTGEFVGWLKSELLKPQGGK